jgi:formyltetrahydrofolate-dependent phosphoribosylglycinamide formyltransferase
MRTAVLISGRGSNLAALIEAARAPGFPARLALVLSNEPEAGGLDHAAAAGIATAVVPHRGRSKAQFEAALQAALDAAGIELIALAGFMRVLSPGFVERWAGRMINIHPSLLPAFPGLDTHARALAAGVRLAGCTVHFVSAAVDGGAIIGQAAVPVRPDDTAASLAARVLAAEHRLYPACLALVAGGQVRLDGGRLDWTAAPAEGLLANPPA